MGFVLLNHSHSLEKSHPYSSSFILCNSLFAIVKQFWIYNSRSNTMWWLVCALPSSSLFLFCFLVPAPWTQCSCSRLHVHMCVHTAGCGQLIRACCYISAIRTIITVYAHCCWPNQFMVIACFDWQLNCVSCIIFLFSLSFLSDFLDCYSGVQQGVIK